MKILRKSLIVCIFLFVSSLKAEITKENDDFYLGKVIGDEQKITQMNQDGVLIKTSVFSSDMPKIMFDKNIGLPEAEWLGAKTIVISKHLSNIANANIYVYGIIIGLNKELIKGGYRTYWKVLTGFDEQGTPLILTVGLDYHLRLMHDSWMSYNRDQKFLRGGILENPKHRYLILKDLPIDQAAQIIKQKIEKEFNQGRIYLEEIPVKKSLPAVPVKTVKQAMPKPVKFKEKAKPIAPTRTMNRNIRNDFIDVDPTEIYYNTGSKDHLRFYGEYRVKQNGDFLSFKVTDCDPLSIYTFGDIRYFFNSAIEGTFPKEGEPIKIEDPSLTNFVAARAINEFNRYRCEIYLGYNQNEFKVKRNKRFHLAKLLALQIKDTKNVDQTMAIKLYAPASNIRTEEISREICKHIKDRKDCGWRSDVFQEAIRKLLGKGWTSSKGRLYPNSASDETIYRRDEAVFSNGAFYSTKVYWTQNENKLKGIIYRH